MKKVFRLLEWFNINDIKFSLQDMSIVGDEEGNFLIHTNRYEIETINYCHEIEVTGDNEDPNEKTIEEFEIWYNKQ